MPSSHNSDTLPNNDESHINKYIYVDEETEDNTEIMANIGKLIDDFENKHGVFNLLKSDLILEIKESNYDIVCDILSTVYDKPIESLYKHDFCSFLMILLSFFGVKSVFGEWKSDNRETAVPESREAAVPENQEAAVPKKIANCKSYLHVVLIMCYISRKMENRLKSKGNKQTVSNFHEIAEELEKRACHILERMDESQHELVLKINYTKDHETLGGTIHRDGFKILYPHKYSVAAYKEYIEYGNSSGKELMHIAYEAEAMKFLAHMACTSYVKKRYYTPYLICKLFFHILVEFIYIILFSLVLCKYKIDENEPWWTVIWPISVLVYIFTQFVDTIVKLMSLSECCSPKKSYNVRRFVKIRQYVAANKIHGARSILFIFLVISESIRFSFISNSHYFYSIINVISETLYCILFAMSVFSFVRYFYCCRLLGFFLHVFKEMWKTVLLFCLIFLVFWYTLGVIHISMTRSMSDNNTFVYSLATKGRFEIFGEVGDRDKNGQIDGCDGYNRTIYNISQMDPSEISCLFRTTTVPFILFVYMFSTAILLINLLTAQLTKEYENESERAEYYSDYLRYGHLQKLESQIFLPRPLSILYYGFKLFSFCCESCCRRRLRSCFTPDSNLSNDIVDVENKIKKILAEPPENIRTELYQLINANLIPGNESDDDVLNALKIDIVQCIDNRLTANRNAPSRLQVNSAYQSRRNSAMPTINETPLRRANLSAARQLYFNSINESERSIASSLI